MLRRDYPPIINGVTLDLDRGTWVKSYGKVANKNTTEAGTDDIDVLRSGKVTISASFNVTERWAGILIGFDSAPVLTVKDYDPVTKAYKEYSMYMEELASELVPLSDKTESTNGLYAVSFDLVEF